MNLLNIYDLIIDSKLDEAIQKLQSIENTNVEQKVLLAYYYMERRQYSDCTNIVDELFPILEEKSDYRLLLACHTLYLYSFYRIKEFGNIEKTIYLGNETVSQLISMLEYQNSEYFIETSNIWISSYYNIIAIIRNSKGIVSISLDYHELSMKYRKKLTNKMYFASSLNNIGIIYNGRGEYEIANGYFKQALEYVGSKQDTILSALLMINTGISYFYMGNINEARNVLETSILQLDKIKMHHTPTLPILYIALCFLDYGDMVNAKLQIERLQKIKDNYNYKDADLHLRIAKGLYQKAQPRFINRAEAQIILKTIVDEEILEIAITRMAMINLADLLLEEYSLFGNDEAYSELQSIIGVLFQIAQQQGSNTLEIEVLIFQAKFALIQGNQDLCLKLISKARNLANIFNRSRLKRKVNHLQKFVESKGNSKLIYNGDDKISREKRTELLNYLEDLGPIIKGQ